MWPPGGAWSADWGEAVVLDVCPAVYTLPEALAGPQMWSEVILCIKYLITQALN